MIKMNKTEDERESIEKDSCAFCKWVENDLNDHPCDKCACILNGDKSFFEHSGE